MDLYGGVGPLIPINAPKISASVQSQLPKWILNVAYSPQGPQILSQRWEAIELDEKERLEQVLTGKGMIGRFSVSAAMERGDKNKYPNIWPFEWNRIKIPQVLPSQDYFNGSLIWNGQSGGRRYIATQAPVPETFEDFWKVVWGEGVQVIVCLTAAEEGGQVRFYPKHCADEIKCDPYWTTKTAGEMHVMLVHETSVELGAGQSAILRTLMLQNSTEPFTSLREIVHIQYEGWPDFGIPAEATAIVSLVKLVDDVARRAKNAKAPMLVHCSAGCGRTGTFCTVDMVINAIDSGEGRGDQDLIYQTVVGIREQRMSLVQTLRQFVLCYECVLHHILGKIIDNDNQGKMG